MEQDALGFTLLRSDLSFLARSLFIAVAICSTANAEEPPPGKTITPELLSENPTQNPVQKIQSRLHLANHILKSQDHNERFHRLIEHYQVR